MAEAQMVLNIVRKVSDQLTEKFDKFLTDRGVEYSVTKKDPETTFTLLPWQCVFIETRFRLEKAIPIKIQWIPPFTVIFNGIHLDLIFPIEIPEGKFLVQFKPHMILCFDESQIPYDRDDVMSPKELPTKEIWIAPRLPIRLDLLKRMELIGSERNEVFIFTFPDTSAGILAAYSLRFPKTPNNDLEKWDRKWKETGSRNPDDYKFLFKRRIKPSEVEIIRVD